MDWTVSMSISGSWCVTSTARNYLNSCTMIDSRDIETAIECLFLLSWFTEEKYFQHLNVYLDKYNLHFILSMSCLLLFSRSRRIYLPYTFHVRNGYKDVRSRFSLVLSGKTDVLHFSIYHSQV